MQTNSTKQNQSPIAFIYSVTTLIACFFVISAFYLQSLGETTALQYECIALAGISLVFGFISHYIYDQVRTV